MNALMATGGAPLTMTSREIADLTGKRHDNVMRTIETLYERRVIGLPQFEEVPNDGPGPMLVKQYQLLKRDTYVLVAQLSPEFTAALVDRWQELEARQAPALPQTMAQALRLAAEQAEALEAAKPKVEFFDKVMARDTLLTATQVAQAIGMSAIRLNKHLDELGVYSSNVKRTRVFKQWVIDKGYGELKQTEQGFSQPLFTTTGKAWVVERLINEGVVTV